MNEWIIRFFPEKKYHNEFARDRSIPASAPTLCTTPQLRMHSATVYISENIS